MTSITSVCEPIEVYFYVHQVIFKDQKVRPMQSNCFKAGSKLSAFLEDLSCLEDECIIPLPLSLSSIWQKKAMGPRKLTGTHLLACTLQIRLTTFIPCGQDSNLLQAQ